MVEIVAELQTHWEAAGEARGEETGEVRGVITTGRQFGAPESGIINLHQKNPDIGE